MLCTGVCPNISNVRSREDSFCVSPVYASLIIAEVSDLVSDERTIFLVSAAEANSRSCSQISHDYGSQGFIILYIISHY